MDNTWGQLTFNIRVMVSRLFSKSRCMEERNVGDGKKEAAENAEGRCRSEERRVGKEC